MPYLLIQTNKAIGDEEQSWLVTEASKIVAGTLNKPEKYVTVAWTPASKMTFDGDANGAAFLELRSVGIPEAARQKLPGALAKCMAEHLGINADRVYLVMVDVPGKYWAQGNRRSGSLNWLANCWCLKPSRGANPEVIGRNRESQAAACATQLGLCPWRHRLPGASSDKLRP
jgi:phenylpyruvate tautomerase